MPRILFPKFWIVLFMALLVILPACTTAPTPTAAPEPTQAPTAAASATLEPTVVPPTNTPEPTATLVPSPTPVTPTPTNTPVPPEEQVTGWCIPREKAMTVKASPDPVMMPDGAEPMGLKGGALEIVTPALSCTLVFNLGQPVDEGALLHLVDRLGHPWLTTDIIIAPNDPNKGYAVLTHTYVTDPPAWETIYGLEAKNASGENLWAGSLNINKGWLPAPCWDGQLPNPVTLRCHLQQDLHPWDYAYTPLPPGTP